MGFGLKWLGDGVAALKIKKLMLAQHSFWYHTQNTGPDQFSCHILGL